MFARSTLLSLLSLLVYDRSSYKTTEVFCKRFRSACVDYVGPKNQHHQLDCVFDNGKQTQKGPKIHAFCGGLPKNADGSWTNDNSKVVDQTKSVVDRYMNAKLVAKPMGKAACLKFAKRHEGVVC
ncbi:hypothetical protein JCM3766R1_000400 [Sporobolomyces carnicolor]